MANKKQQSNKISNIQIGIYGEYLAAARLSAMGYITTVTLKGTKGIDILVSNEDATHLIGIQVKTTREKQKEWTLSKSNEKLTASNLYYIFIHQYPLDNLTPDFYIVPSAIVAQFITEGHANYLAEGHGDSDIRTYIPNDKFKNDWSILGF